MVLSQSQAVFRSIQSNRRFSLKTPKISPLYPFKIAHIGFWSSGGSISSQDDLIGFIDPDFYGSGHGGLSDREIGREGFDYDAVGSTKSSSCKYSYDALLISNAIRDCSGDFDDKTQKFLRQFGGKCDESLVIDVLKLLDESPESGFRFFIWAVRQIGYEHSGSAFHALLDILGFSKKNRVPENLLREIGDDDNAKVLGKLVNVLIRKCCRNGFWNEALEELEGFKYLGYKPSRTTYNALIQVLLRAGRLDSAFLVHREMSDSGFNMGAFTLGCFARSLCKAGRWREALGIIEKEEFVPDTIIYTKMISGLCEASLFEEAMALLHRMHTNSFIPNVRTYKTLLSGFLRKKQLGRCKRILSMMITEGCKPSSWMFNSLVHAYCSSGDYAYAYKLLKKMVECGFQPGYVTYNILIGGICRSVELPNPDTLELAEKAYAEMLDAGVVLNKVSMGHFARCLCGMGKFQKCFMVIQEMMSRGFIPHTSTYGKVIAFLCQACKVEKAFLLFEDMKKNEIIPDVFTYTILIESLCLACKVQKAFELYDDMRRRGYDPELDLFFCLIKGLIRVNQWDEALQLSHSMCHMQDIHWHSREEAFDGR